MVYFKTNWIEFYNEEKCREKAKPKHHTSKKPTIDKQYNPTQLQHKLKNVEKELYKRKPITITFKSLNVRGIYGNPEAKTRQKISESPPYSRVVNVIIQYFAYKKPTSQDTQKHQQKKKNSY